MGIYYAMLHWGNKNWLHALGSFSCFQEELCSQYKCLVHLKDCSVRLFVHFPRSNTQPETKMTNYEGNYLKFLDDLIVNADVKNDVHRCYVS